MRFKTDENIHPEAAALLREFGHDAMTIWDQNLRGAPDPDIAQVCRAEDRALITFDIGFSDIRTFPPSEYPGIVVLRLGSQSRPHVLATLRRMVRLLENTLLNQRLWIVDDHAVRIRGA